MEKNVRLRILLVMELFFEQTDAEHGVSMGDVLHWLEQNGIAGERKSIYEDIHALQEYGLAIEYFAEDRSYRLVERAMELPELKLLVDAVHASKMITSKRAEQMVSHIMDLSSCYGRGELRREVYSEKPKSPNATGFYSLDLLHQAMESGKQVQFRYSAWTLEKKLSYKHDGRPYRLSPWLMVWAEENYYLVAYDEERNTFKHFRVDKISDVEILDLPRKGESNFRKLDVVNYSTNHFGMYSGEKRRVTVQFENSLIGVVLDRFGTELQIIKEGENHFKVALPVVVSSQFFGWILGLGSQAKILTEEVAKEYTTFVETSLKQYQ